jgi:hypothetical protein
VADRTNFITSENQDGLLVKVWVHRRYCNPHFAVPLNTLCARYCIPVVVDVVRIALLPLLHGPGHNNAFAAFEQIRDLWRRGTRLGCREDPGLVADEFVGAIGEKRVAG